VTAHTPNDLRRLLDLDVRGRIEPAPELLAQALHLVEHVARGGATSGRHAPKATCSPKKGSGSRCASSGGEAKGTMICPITT